MNGHKVSIGVIIVLIVQTVVVGYWAGGLENRVSSRNGVMDRVTVLEIKDEAKKEKLTAIEAKLDAILRVLYVREEQRTNRVGEGR